MKQSTQDYLKAIFSLSKNRFATVVKVNNISKKLDVSPAAVSDMVKKLEASGYVTSLPYRGLSLTEAGWEIGCNMVRHHRIWETFLHDELGIPKDQVHDEAERLEHACSDTLINKLEEKMGFPKLDPHGNPIPNRFGKFS